MGPLALVSLLVEADWIPNGPVLLVRRMKAAVDTGPSCAVFVVPVVVVAVVLVVVVLLVLVLAVVVVPLVAVPLVVVLVPAVVLAVHVVPVVLVPALAVVVVLAVVVALVLAVVDLHAVVVVVVVVGVGEWTGRAWQSSGPVPLLSLASDVHPASWSSVRSLVPPFQCLCLAHRGPVLRSGSVWGSDSWGIPACRGSFSAKLGTAAGHYFAPQ